VVAGGSRGVWTVGSTGVVCSKRRGNEGPVVSLTLVGAVENWTWGGGRKGC